MGNGRSRDVGGEVEAGDGILSNNSCRVILLGARCQYSLSRMLIEYTGTAGNHSWLTKSHIVLGAGLAS